MSKNFELLQQTSGEQRLFRVGGCAAAVLELPATQPTATALEAEHIGIPKSSSLPLRWPELIRETAAKLREQIRIRSHSRGRDEHAIALAEEVKLVQRIFPPGNPAARRVVLFSGIDEDAGSGFTCARAAQALAARGEGSVCVVDAAVRSPAIHHYFGLENTKGWADAVMDSLPIQEYAQQPGNGNLWVVPAGTAAWQLGALSSGDRLGGRIGELRARFQYVLFYSAPLGLDPFAVCLGQLADGIVLVLEANGTRRERARRMKARLEAAGARVVGVVLNNRTFPIPEALYRRL